MASEVARLVGLEQRSYEKDGQQKHYCGLHLCYVEGTVEGIEGCKVDSVSCPRNVEPKLLKVGQLYELVYTMFDTKNGKMARLVDLKEVDE